jgi:hypothetical protein
MRVLRSVGSVAVLAVLLGLPASSGATTQYAEVRTGFWDGVTDPSFCRVNETDANFADVSCTATDASQRTVYPPPDNLKTVVTSVGSSVTMAHASPGSVGASVYNGYIVGYDNYYGYADARTEDTITITGGTPNGTATVAVGAIVNGGLGIYGSDAAADARAYFRFSGNSGVTGDSNIFRDRAYGEENFDSDFNLLPPTHVYEYGVREDYRYVDVALDGSGEGSFTAELILDISAFEEGDESLYESAAAADYGSTIDVHLQPWNEDFGIGSAWQVRAFGTALDTSPAPVTLTLEQLGIVPEPGLATLLLAGLVGVFASTRSR